LREKHGPGTSLSEGGKGKRNLVPSSVKKRLRPDKGKNPGCLGAGHRHLAEKKRKRFPPNDEPISSRKGGVFLFRDNQREREVEIAAVIMGKILIEGRKKKKGEVWMLQLYHGTRKEKRKGDKSRCHACQKDERRLVQGPERGHGILEEGVRPAAQ